MKLSTNQYIVLTNITSSRGLTAPELAGQISALSRPAVYTALNELERRGLIYSYINRISEPQGRFASRRWYITTLGRSELYDRKTSLR